MAKHKRWSAEAKFEIALLAIKGETTLSEICKRYEVAPSQVHLWKKQLVEQGAQLFSRSDKVTAVKTNHEKVVRELYEKVGQLIIERDFLKKSWTKFHGINDDS